MYDPTPSTTTTASNVHRHYVREIQPEANVQRITVKVHKITRDPHFRRFRMIAEFAAVVIVQVQVPIVVGFEDIGYIMVVVVVVS